MKRVAGVVLYGILALANAQAEVNTTSLSQLIGKMPPVGVRTGICKCVVYLIENDDEIIGFGASLIGGVIAIHKKVLRNATKYMIKFDYNNQNGWAELIGIDRDVAQMQIINDGNINLNDIAYARMNLYNRGWHTKSVSWDGCRTIKKNVIIKDQNDEFFYTVKEKKNVYESEGDLLFFGAALIGILVELPSSNEMSKYQNIRRIRETIKNIRDNGSCGNLSKPSVSMDELESRKV